MYTQCTYHLKCNLQMDAYPFYYIIPCSRKQGIKLKEDYKIQGKKIERSTQDNFDIIYHLRQGVSESNTIVGTISQSHCLVFR